MTEYQKQAEDFCQKWGVKIEINPVSIDAPEWDKEGNKHIHYKVTISRNTRSFTFDFWGSIAELEKYRLSVWKRKYHYRWLEAQPYINQEWVKKEIAKDVSDSDVLISIIKTLGPMEERQNETVKRLRKERRALIINSYDILVALNFFFDGSIDDFINEFGYEIKSRKDYLQMENAYHETLRQNRELNYMFPEPKAMEELQEIA